MTPQSWLGIGLAVTVLGVVGGSRWQVNSLRADLAESRSNATQLRAEIAGQKVAIKGWREEAERKRAAAQSALASASVQRRKADGLAATLSTLKLPEEECNALVTLVESARTGGL